MPVTKKVFCDKLKKKKKKKKNHVGAYIFYICAYIKMHVHLYVHKKKKVPLYAMFG